MEWVEQISYSFGKHVLKVLSYPILPDQRLFYLYLLSSFAFAIGVYCYSPNYKEDKEAGRGFIKGLFAFVFPKKVWQHPSAWVDVRFFIPHQILRLWLYTDFMGIFAVLSHFAITTVLQNSMGTNSMYTFPADHIFLVISYTIVSLIVVDFSSFFTHYFQHKIPILWEFHKIHHSAKVLHPLSNYREHPIDNVSYAITTGISLGVVNGAFAFLFSVTPAELFTPLLGIGIAAFSFNFFGFHLRHSHIWLRWPGILAFIFGCPAHHQIHHSCKPKHIDKNFAFQLPIWDILFGTFYLPKQEEELEIGLGDGTEHQYKSYLTMYTLPFINLLKQSPEPEKTDDNDSA